MLDALIVSIAFIVLFVIFWYLQLRTRYFSTRYYLQVCLLLAIGILCVYVVVRLLNLPFSPMLVAAVLLVGAISIYHTGLALIKLRESDTRYRWMHKANRAIVSYDSPHERFSLRTDDGQKIQAIALCNPEGKSDKAVIVCHGAGRSKNTISIVQTCKILATKYDVYTFDFRGHMESGGTFKGDGDTEFDLKAMVDYVRRAGYKKLAVFGWSVGAWTALLSAARGRPIDAIVAGSPPPFNMSSLFFIRWLERLKLLRLPMLPGIAVIRNMWITSGNHQLNIEEFVGQVPRIPILLVFNDFDYASHADASAFEALYDRLPATSSKFRLPGKGHMFDWPNTFFLWTKLLAWLEENF